MIDQAIALLLRFLLITQEGVSYICISHLPIPVSLLFLILIIIPNYQLQNSKISSTEEYFTYTHRLSLQTNHTYVVPESPKRNSLFK